MPLTLWDEMLWAGSRILSEIVPSPHARKPLGWREIPQAFAYVVPFYFMAYLVRRRDTQLTRLLLLPTIIILALRGTFYYSWDQPEFAFLNWIRGLLGLSIIALAIDYALTKEGRFKIGEKRLPAVHEDNGSSLSWLTDATDVIFSLRCIGWEVGKGVFIPPDTRPQERGPFLRATALMCLKNFLVVDLIVSQLQFLPGIGSPAGGTVFLPNLPMVPRYLFSISIAAISGIGMVSGFQTLHAISTLVAVGLLGQPPSAWPPLMKNPYGSHSISDLWAKRWHQMLRRVFLVYGGIPGGWIAGRPGVVLGTFIASGLLHECGIYVLGRGLDHRVTLFFASQGVFVLLEVLWKRVTGYTVRGWGGRIWTYVIVLSGGQMCMDAWFLRGLGGAVFVPRFISPVRLIIFPLVKHIVAAIS